MNSLCPLNREKEKGERKDNSMQIHLILVPYDLGRENHGMGKAPLLYREAGAQQLLTDNGHTVLVKRLYVEELPAEQLHASVAVNKLLAHVVAETLEANAFPLILGGSCDLSLGILGGFEHAQTGIIWLDAHADLNTPETTVSGYFGGMPLAIATGRCYQDLWSQIGNSAPVEDSHVVMVGVRDVDEQEQIQLTQSAITVLPVETLQQEQPQARLQELATEVRDIYLHFDLDVHDGQNMPGFDFPVPGGPTPQEVEQAIHTITHYLPIKAAALTAYNPDRDPEQKTLQTALNMIATLAEAAQRR
jgi:arginase